jgi:Uma2 family endonuclease
MLVVARRAEDLWYVTRQQYVDAERVAATKSEWVDGVVFAIAGASKRHVAAVARLVELFAAKARQRGCLLGSSDLLVATENAHYYPDVVASCDPSDDPYVEHNPCFIAEVLSPSTSRTDRIEKRDAFLALASMQTFWIVDPDAKVIEAWERGESGWSGRHHSADDVLSIACLDVSVRAADVVGV